MRALLVALALLLGFGPRAAAQELLLGDEGGSIARAMIATRSSSLLPTVSVPSFRPITPNTAIALDLVPNGSPAEFGTNGFTWFDACDADILNAGIPVRCARMGMRSNAAQFGPMWWNGATGVPGELVYGEGNPVFRWNNFSFAPTADANDALGQPNGRWLTIYTVEGELVAELRSLKKRVAALEKK